MDAKNAAHIVAGMATMSRNSTTRVHLLAGSAEEAGTAAVAAIVAETAAAAALLLAGRRGPVLPPREWPLLGLEDGWDQPGRSIAYLVEAATEEFVAESAPDRIGRS